MTVARVFAELGLEVFERGWLSSNNILFHGAPGSPVTLVDTGYALHAAQTVELVRTALAGRALDRIVNTHLHSDHCGGNALLQAAYGCEVVVPEAYFDIVRDWDESRLSYQATGQRCDRFAANGFVGAGATVTLGRYTWQVHAAPGHDPDSVMYFQPDAKVLISADALWEERVSIIFPEIAGEAGFDEAMAAIDVVESLSPAIVIPGHGRCFTDWRSAVTQSRRRLNTFRRQPDKHALYGARALTMFHMLEHQERTRSELQDWLLRTPVFRALHRMSLEAHLPLDEFSSSLVQGLVAGGQLRNRGERLVVGD